MSSNVNEIKRRRTFAIISHPDAGKTTLTEKFLLYGGAIALAGSVKGKKTAKHAGIAVVAADFTFRILQHFAKRVLRLHVYFNFGKIVVVYDECVSGAFSADSGNFTAAHNAVAFSAYPAFRGHVFFGSFQNILIGHLFILHFNIYMVIAVHFLM